MQSRVSKWRVWKRVDYRAQTLCQIFGMDPNDLVQVALDRYVDDITKEWRNVETFAVVMEIRSNPEWEEIAFMADDYKEFTKLMVERNMTQTRSGISIKDKRIARRRVDIEIRKRNNFHDEKDDD